MSINTKTRLTILASVVALAFAAPAAFAQGAGTTDKKGIHTDAGGTPDAPAATHTDKVMKKKDTSGTAAPVTGTTDKKGIHTDAAGTPDAPAARHTEKVMNKKAASSGAARQSGPGYRPEGATTDTTKEAAQDTTAGSKTKKVKKVRQKRMAPSGPASPDTQQPGQTPGTPKL
jgi:hypothetical protein